MTARPPDSARPCAAVGCDQVCVDPTLVLNVAPAGALPYPVPLCPDHWRDVDQGAEWLATETPGDRTSRGIHVLMGAELAKRRLAVPEGAGITWSRAGFSAQLAPDRNVGVLGVDGRVLGSADRVHLELVLTPDAVRQLRSVLALYPEAADPH